MFFDKLVKLYADFSKQRVEQKTFYFKPGVLTCGLIREVILQEI